MFVQAVQSMRNNIFRYNFHIFKSLDDQAGASKSNYSWRFHQKLSEEAMVHLAEIPLADFFLLQQTIDYPIIVRNVFVFVTVPEDYCVEVE